jgi:hypothetical protein
MRCIDLNVVGTVSATKVTAEMAASTAMHIRPLKVFQETKKQKNNKQQNHLFHKALLPCYLIKM